MTLTNLVFLDTETTGLDPRIHEVWEVAYAINDGPIQTHIVTHSLATADPKALEMNGYRERGFAFPSGWADVDLKAALTGVTIVGANPGFDTDKFLFARWGVEPWHHRKIDVESMALTVLGYERPKGLRDLAADLRDRGHDIPAPDHSAAADVATTRAVYNALRAEATR